MSLELSLVINIQSFIINGTKTRISKTKNAFSITLV